MSTEKLASRGSLDDAHYDVLSQAFRNVLHTDVAVETYAQLIDGLPLQETCRDKTTLEMHSYLIIPSICTKTFVRGLETRQ